MILRWPGIQQVMALDDPRLHTAHLWILPVPRPARTFAVTILIYLADRVVTIWSRLSLTISRWRCFVYSTWYLTEKSLIIYKKTARSLRFARRRAAYFNVTSFRRSNREGNEYKAREEEKERARPRDDHFWHDRHFLRNAIRIRDTCATTLTSYKQ